MDRQANTELVTCSGRNSKPLIQIEPKMVIDQKNREAFADGGDVLLANGNRIPLPGGFPLPTTGLWSRILDIPEVRSRIIPAYTPDPCEAPLTSLTINGHAMRMSRWE